MGPHAGRYKDQAGTILQNVGFMKHSPLQTESSKYRLYLDSDNIFPSGYGQRTLRKNQRLQEALRVLLGIIRDFLEHVTICLAKIWRRILQGRLDRRRGETLGKSV